MEKEAPDREPCGMRIITGCPRSGTSFVAQLIHRFGGNFGSENDLIAGDEWNRNGYFENKAVNRLNHRLLFGRWSNPDLWVDVMWPRDWRIRMKKLATSAMAPVLTRPSCIRRRGEEWAAEIVDLSANLAGIVVKDPRFSLLMPAWEAHVRPESILYVLRHPWESAASMSRQTRLPLFITYKVWADHVEKFWDHPPKTRTYIVDYNACFDRQRALEEVKTLFAFMGVDYDPAVAESTLASTFDSALCSRVVRPDARLPGKIAHLYERILDEKRQS